MLLILKNSFFLSTTQRKQFTSYAIINKPKVFPERAANFHRVLDPKSSFLYKHTQTTLTSPRALVSSGKVYKPTTKATKVSLVHFRSRWPVGLNHLDCSQLKPGISRKYLKWSKRFVTNALQSSSWQIYFVKRKNRQKRGVQREKTSSLFMWVIPRNVAPIYVQYVFKCLQNDWVSQ